MRSLRPKKCTQKGMADGKNGGTMKQLEFGRKRELLLPLRPLCPNSLWSMKTK